MKKIINTNIGLVIICLFCAVCVMADFIVIDKALDSYVDYSKCNCAKYGDSNLNLGCVTDNTSVVEENKNDDTSHYVISDDFSFDGIYKDNNVLDSDMNIRTVKDLIVFTGEYYGFLSVDNGKLNLNINRYFFDSESRITYVDTNFETVYLSHSFDGENIEYIYYNYFKPSGDHVIWVLTDAGNVNLNNFNFYHNGFNTDFFDKFEKKYSNVSDLRIIENIRKNVIGEDYVSKDLAIVVNGEPIEISKWGN